MFVVGASSDLGQSFRPRQKSWFGEVTEQVSRYDIHAEGAFPPSVSNHDNESKKPELLNLQCFSEIINSKQKCMRLQFLKVTVALNFEWKEGNVLFNDALNTFYLRLYGIGHMVQDHSDSERGNPLPPHGLHFPINSKGSFICTIPQTG